MAACFHGIHINSRRKEAEKTLQTLKFNSLTRLKTSVFSGFGLLQKIQQLNSRTA